MAETDAEWTILDYVDDIKVLGRVFDEPANEYWALVCLRHGLELLYRQAARCDKLVQQDLEAKSDAHGVRFVNDPAFHQVPKPLLTCAFHWYAVAACQYVRTVGAIAYRNDHTRSLPLHYVKSVIPEVLAFRDKVAAHFAWTTQHGRDNDAERAVSVMPPLGFQQGSFHVGLFEVYKRSGGTASTSESIAPWSISEVHPQLRKRYWPEQVSVTSLAVDSGPA
jgi:hypothetical protein